MIVCLCRVVSDRAVREAIDEGANTVEQVGLHCGAGTGCGACEGVINELIEERCSGCPRRDADWSPYAAAAAEPA